jgi:3-dehydroquinate dehydratase-2
MRVLVLNGPNLNLLGSREPGIYGTGTLADIEAALSDRARTLEVEITCHQSNSEGELVDLIQAAAGSTEGIVINPGGYSHTSVAIRDALAAVGLPAVEVHLSNPSAREWFRHVDLVAGACRGVIAGFGQLGYLMALERVVEMSRPSGSGSVGGA